MSLGVAKGIGWSTGLSPLGKQALRDCFNVGDGKRDVANADLIQHDRRATHRIARVLSQHQEGYRLRIAVAQVHHASLRVAIVIQVGQTAPTGVLHFVLRSLENPGRRDKTAASVRDYGRKERRAIWLRLG